MMDCLCSIAPSDEDLLRHVLDGEALPKEAIEHLEQCIVCQQRLAHYREANTFLLSHLYRSQCPDSMKLSYYCAGILSQEEMKQTASHVEMCPFCANELKDIQSSFTPLDFFDIRLAVSTDMPGFSEHADSIVKPLGKSSAQAGEESAKIDLWPRCYQADGFTLALHLSYDYHESAVIWGSLSCPHKSDALERLSGIRVELYSTTMVQASDEQMGQAGSLFPCATCLQSSTAVDCHGALKFCRVPAGEYLMVLYLPEMAMVIEELSVEQH